MAVAHYQPASTVIPLVGQRRHTGVNLGLEGGPASRGRRRMLVTAVRLVPTRVTTFSWVKPNSSMNC
ncbi:MAG: hypothetical protein ACLPR9_02485 [Acidimicrobiales bacterium]